MPVWGTEAQRLKSMALINCPECNREISDTAKVCPSCGYKINLQKYKKRNKIIFGVILSVIIVSIGFYVIYSINKRNKALEALDKEIVEFTKYPQRPHSYTDLSYLLQSDTWNISNDDFSSIRATSTWGIMNNIPFEQTKIYLEWDSYYKYQFTKKK